jgi:nitrous oxidase accessory protein
VADGAPLQALLDAATPGSALCLSPGRYDGPLRIDRGLTLWGPATAMVRSRGRGTTVTLTQGARLQGLSVDGSGARFDVLDAAVHLSGEGGAVEGVEITHALFGILVEQARGVTVRGNHVRGSYAQAVGMRGDAIRLWETTDSRVEENRVEGARDLVVWYSSRNRILNNEVRDGRYGTHFMYSHDNHVEGNRYLGNEVGIFVMYSHGIVLTHNLLADASGASGMGLGLKESGNLTVTDNRFLHDTVGIYVDTSPLQLEDHDLFARNELRLSQVAVVFHSSEQRNAFRENVFRDNDVQVQVEGDGDALGVEWAGNDFDDYAGYDLDRDGFGDLPYELRSLSGALVSAHPTLAFFRGSPALALVSAAGQVLPLFAPKPLVRDPRPRTAPFAWEARDAR